MYLMKIAQNAAAIGPVLIQEYSHRVEDIDNEVENKSGFVEQGKYMDVQIQNQTYPKEDYYELCSI